VNKSPACGNSIMTTVFLINEFLLPVTNASLTLLGRAHKILFRRRDMH